MDSLFEDHLASPRGLGRLSRSPHAGAAGGAACGDLVRISVDVADGHVREAGFEARGCAAARAAGSAVVELVEGRPLLEVARIDAQRVSSEAGGLSPGSFHAAGLAADALHRALGAALRNGAAAVAPLAGRTVVAMSGGVDSAAAAQIALEAGDDVIGVTLELWSDPATDGERSCCSPQAVIGARALAHRMGIPHFTLDLRESFRRDVVEDFLAGYAAGLTPNPCVRCNGLVRFDALLDATATLGAARLGTGHYARVENDGVGPLVHQAADLRKDQSYVLARLDAPALERLWFPLGGLDKGSVRELARDAGLPVAEKPESQDLCFLAGLGAQGFMRRHGGEALQRAEAGGEIVDRAGRVLGRHGGHHRYTVGQRRGLGIGSPEPLYVLSKDARRNRVTVGPRSALARRRVGLSPGHLHRRGKEVDAVRLRYHSAAIPCSLEGSAGRGVHERLRLSLGREVGGAAPGQLACLLRGDAVVGWGTISEDADGH